MKYFMMRLFQVFCCLAHGGLIFRAICVSKDPGLVFCNLFFWAFWMLSAASYERMEVEAR